MCGIFGALEGDCVGKTLQALHFLEYRGYDSAGIAVKTDKLTVIKSKGRISALESKLPQKLEGNSAIGHTRWATHGAVCDENAHPFLSADGSFAICHNGIIENHLQLKEDLLQSGVKCVSQTDSETVAHLLQINYRGNVLQTVAKTALQLQGAFAILVSSVYDDNLYALKNKSPLVVGLSENGTYLCSDVRCISRWANKVAVVPDNTVVAASKNNVSFFDFQGKPKNVDFFTPDKAQAEQETDGDVMLKEIFEIPERVRDAKQGYFQSGGLGFGKRLAGKFRRIYFIGCGTAYNSGAEVCALARKFLTVDIIPVIASEFVYDNYPVDDKTLAFCISQSGETADTIRAAEKVSSLGGFTYAVTNTTSSTLCFVCDKVKNVFAGGEFAVASTKAYNCQLVTLLLLALDIAHARGEISDECLRSVHNSMDKLPLALNEILRQNDAIAKLANQIKHSSAVFFVGRASDYPTATEGSLKLKEISYVHSEAYPSGELKHGTLALMESGVTVVVISTCDKLVEKNNSTANEIASRNATVVTLSPYRGDGMQITLPVVHEMLYGIVAIVPLQLLAYHVAKSLGRDVDKPRNLAKSVTVE